jgi:hypothetical protein
MIASSPDDQPAAKSGYEHATLEASAVAAAKAAAVIKPHHLFAESD